VKVDRWGETNLWGHSQKSLVMSATLISADEMADSLGVEDGQWGLVKVGSDFPAENRPIHVLNVAEMTAKNKDEAWPKMAEAVVGVARLHPDERILVHAHSYALAGELTRALLAAHPRRRIVTYTQASQRQGALQRYLDTPGAVLVAASMDRGVDLPGDACRVQVVAKVPYPYLGDKQVSARMHAAGGRAWYSVQAVRSLVQMTGRGVRSRDDRCETYILDGSFVNNLWNRNRRLFPKWWTEALDWRFDVRRLSD
jgi:ATP-dependent DNA helicase DinG